MIERCMNHVSLDFYFVFRPDSLVVNDLFRDFDNSSKVSLIPVYTDWNKSVVSFRCLYTTGWKFYKLFSWLDKTCCKKYPFRDLLNNHSNETKCFIFCNSTLIYLSHSILKELSSKDDVVLVLLLVDPMARIYVNDKPKFKYFDQIYSFDPADSKTCGFNFLSSYYSKFDIHCDGEINTGVYFCGADKGRIDNLLKIYETLTNNGIECSFHVRNVSKKKQKYSDSIHYFSKAIAYSDVVNELNKFSCLLDLTQSNQAGVTIRYYEAVCYNKKLLTDNAFVKELPFYNPEYMKVFKSVDDIDIEWIKKPMNIDYGYDGRFSPLNLLDRIQATNNASKSFSGGK